MEEELDVGSGPRPASRRRATLAVLALVVVATAAVAMVVLDLLLVPEPGQRAFIVRNVECLRCHTELIPRMEEASVHQPFATAHCTSCHTPHGEERAAVRASGTLGPQWLRQALERIGLEIVWRVLSALKPVPSASTSVSHSAAPRSGLIMPEPDLCWSCHAKLAPERLLAFQHQPFAESHCASCHDPHASMQPTLLRAQTADLCVGCHFVAPEFLSPVVHLPFGERRCVACHEPHASSQPVLLTAEQRTLCLGCHDGVRREVADAVVHEPVSGRCTTCHHPHSAFVARLLAAPTPELCYGCHDGVRVQFTASSRHPVPGRLSCGDCHRPHGAPVRGLLSVAQRRLCLGCHPRVGTELTRAVKHAPAAAGDCTRCHRPHGSADAPLLQAADPALCGRCHGSIPARPARSPAPFHGYYQPPSLLQARVPPDPKAPFIGYRWKGVPDPILDPGPANTKAAGETSHRVSRCGDCHEAHASDHARLTVVGGNALCVRCHAPDVPRMGASAHRAVACTRCHAPHRAADTRLLKASTPGLCLGCHPGYTHSGDFHPVGARYYDYLAKGPLTCTSTCHDPHGSRYVRMLRVPYDGNDSICLLCHTQVGLTY